MKVSKPDTAAAASHVFSRERHWAHGLTRRGREGKQWFWLVKQHISSSSCWEEGSSSTREHLQAIRQCTLGQQQRQTATGRGGGVRRAC